MTNEFRELTSRLAKGLNFEGGSVCLITAAEDEDDIIITLKGDGLNLALGICKAISIMLEGVNDEEARIYRDMFKQQLIADEERRFQSSPIDDESEDKAK